MEAQERREAGSEAGGRKKEERNGEEEGLVNRLIWIVLTAVMSDAYSSYAQSDAGKGGGERRRRAARAEVGGVRKAICY